eukprot:4524862-Amphidinium_carterae.1
MKGPQVEFHVKSSKTDDLQTCWILRRSRCMCASNIQVWVKLWMWDNALNANLQRHLTARSLRPLNGVRP